MDIHLSMSDRHSSILVILLGSSISMFVEKEIYNRVSWAYRWNSQNRAKDRTLRYTALELVRLWSTPFSKHKLPGMSKVGAKPLKSYGKVYWQIVVPHLGGWLLNIFEDILWWPFRSFLRSPWGLKYIDDLFLLGKTYNLSVTNIIDTFMQFDSLEFKAHVEKSVLYPPKD